MFDTVLLTASKVQTFAGDQLLTTGSGFFFERDRRLFFATSRHVVIDEPSGHAPDRIAISIHVDVDNLAHCVAFSIPLYRDGMSDWRQGEDDAGPIDVAVIEIDRSKLPAKAALFAFRPEHIAMPGEASPSIEIGAQLLVLGFPLGFHDTLHHFPVARQAIVASSFGFRFEGRGYFLTDARTHRGSSGAPVIMHLPRGDGDSAGADLPWRLLGIHSARLDLASRDADADEALGLNCAWYADILMTLTDG